MQARMQSPALVLPEAMAALQALGAAIEKAVGAARHAQLDRGARQSDQRMRRLPGRPLSDHETKR